MINHQIHIKIYDFITLTFRSPSFILATFSVNFIMISSYRDIRTSLCHTLDYVIDRKHVTLT